ncbi:hypothetical protein [Halorubrum trapanicum]|uniref:hypothetical protein n=1 Tax=Halorubrum trapanicum TaxID=29284 RepID=UPI000BBAD656|nr:hypothetical protein [Halorubrum trapanicum]
MSDDVTVDVEVEVEVDRDELEIERDDAELIEATYEANGIEIEVEAEVETHGGPDDEHGAGDESEEDESGYEDFE